MLLLPVARSITDVVLDVARRHLPAQTRAAFDPSTSLRDAGITSLSLVAFICDLEESVNISFPSDAMTEATFHSVETIVAAMSALETPPSA